MDDETIEKIAVRVAEIVIEKLNKDREHDDKRWAAAMDRYEKMQKRS